MNDEHFSAALCDLQGSNLRRDCRSALEWDNPYLKFSFGEVYLWIYVPKWHFTTSKGSVQTASMHRLIWGLAGRTYHIVGNLMSQLIWFWKRCHLMASILRYQKKNYFINSESSLLPPNKFLLHPTYGLGDGVVLWISRKLTSRYPNTPQFQQLCFSILPRPRGYKTFFMQLNWAENLSCSLMFKCQQLLAF